MILLRVIFGLMTAAAIAAVLLPLVRRRAEEFSGNDIAVYRDQLGELDRDRAAGLIGKSEAEAARVEISGHHCSPLPMPMPPEPHRQLPMPVPAARVRRCIIAAALLLLPGQGPARFIFDWARPSLPAMSAGDAVQPEKQTQLKRGCQGRSPPAEQSQRTVAVAEVLAPLYCSSGATRIR